MADKFLDLGDGSKVRFKDMGDGTYAEVISLAGGGGAQAVISGDYKVGSVLTATPSAGYSFTAGVWKRDGVAISGQTALTYTQVVADIGHVLSFTPTSPVYAAPGGVTSADVPGVPTIGTATAGNATVTIPYTDPVNDGGAAITSHDAVLYDAAGNVVYTMANAPNPAMFTAAHGVANGSSYKGAVRARNSVGPGLYSALSNAVTAALAAFKNTGTMRLIGTSAQVAAASPVTFTGGMASRIVKIQAPSAAIGARISVHNLSPTMGVNYIKASVAPTDIAAVDTVANAYNAYANGVTHNVTASGADPLGFIKATWGGATQSRRLEPSNAVLPSFSFNNQQDTVTSDPIMGLVPKRATDRTNEEYYFLIRLTIGLVKDYDGLVTPVASAVTGPNAEYAATNGADSVLWFGGDLGLVDGVDGAYTLPTVITKPEAMPIMSVEWIYPTSTQAVTFLHAGDSITEGYSWPRRAVNRKSTVARPLHHVNLGGSTTRTDSFLGNMYLWLQSNAKPDYVVMPIISINNYSPLSDFNLAAAQVEVDRLKAVAAFLTGIGVKIIWWTPLNYSPKVNPAPGDYSTPWAFVYNSAKVYAAANNITWMEINGDPRVVWTNGATYNNPVGQNLTSWNGDGTHPSNPVGIEGFATIYGETLTALGY